MCRRTTRWAWTRQRCTFVVGQHVLIALAAPWPPSMTAIRGAGIRSCQRSLKSSPKRSSKSSPSEKDWKGDFHWRNGRRSGTCASRDCRCERSLRRLGARRRPLRKLWLQIRRRVTSGVSRKQLVSIRLSHVFGNCWRKHRSLTLRCSRNGWDGQVLIRGSEVIAIHVDVFDHLLVGRSSSAAKKADAVFKISFALRSSLFSCRRRFSSSSTDSPVLR